ncbi:hypothetical protein GCM10027168_00190 [Streptomyces capparidis]
MSGDGARGQHSVGSGRYELQHLLGQGGMASVHLGLDKVLDRRVAVKTLHTDLCREAAFRERFRREAQAVAKLNHTNIVSVFDTGEDMIDGAPVPYIVMEFVEGKPLRDVLDEDIAQHGAMPTEKALEITADVLAALEASHEMGLVHRDIKPGNVMVTARGVVKVMDFGIARALQSGVTSMTQTGMVVGTPQYLSPEQALGRGVDARSDLYSVGCMLFELLTGRLPFDGDSPLAIAYQHVQEEPPAPSSINQAVPPAVDALVARALRKNPAERFPTADAMREEAKRVSGGATVNTPLIISEGPRAHSASQAVASQVFPQVSGSLPGPPAASVQTPYVPPTPPPAFGPQTPPPAPAPAPLPHQSPTPPPAPQMGMGGYPPPPGPATPPPFNLGPSAPPPPGSSSKKVIGVIAAVLVLAVVVIVAVSAANKGDEDKPDPWASSSTTSSPQGGGTDGGTTTTGGDRTGGTDVSTSPSASAGQSIKPGQPYQQVEKSECTDPEEIGGEIMIPSFVGATVEDARACTEAAGWELVEESENESLYGEGIVIDQDPKIDWVDPDSDIEITVWVSTGHD